MNPRPFKQTLDLDLTGTNIDNNDRGTVTGCEWLRWYFYWALREHWGSDPEFEQEGWLEVPGITKSDTLSFQRSGAVFLRCDPRSLQ